MNNTERGGERTQALLAGARRLYFAGMGGISMEGLAHMAREAGYTVAGCDRDPGARKRLSEAGFPTDDEGDADPRGCDALIFSAAIAEDNPAAIGARRAGIPLISRADFLSALMLRFPVRVAVSGMHGKSTTVGMLAAIFEAAGMSPTVAGGAPLSVGAPAWRCGGKEIFLAEACEYRDSFLSLSPTHALVTNIELDHPDYFPDLSAVGRSFAAFLGKSERRLIHLGCPELVRIAPPGCETYGFLPGATFRGEEVADGFSVWERGASLGVVRLSVRGSYNRENALGATALARMLGVPFSAIGAGLAAFSGIGRRMEEAGSARGARVFLDYAHHPTEMRAAIGAAKEGGGRVLCVFQPHTYTRTQALWDEFALALAQPDLTVLVDIYPARESPIPGITSQNLAQAASVTYAKDLPTAARILRGAAAVGDTLLVMGAGDVTGILPYLLDPV